MDRAAWREKEARVVSPYPEISFYISSIKSTSYQLPACCRVCRSVPAALVCDVVTPMDCPQTEGGA